MHNAPAMTQMDRGGNYGQDSHGNYPVGPVPTGPPPSENYGNNAYPPPPGPPTNAYNQGGFQAQPPPPPTQYNNEYSQGQGQGHPQPQYGQYNMTSSQPYAPPPPPPQNQQIAEYGNGGKPYDNAPFSQADESTGPRFEPRKRINDIVPLILFIAAIAGFGVLSGIAISSFVRVNGLSGSGVGVGGGVGRTGSAVTLN